MSDLMNHPRIEMLRVSALKPNPRPTRIHTERQAELIAASMRRHGFVVPIIVDAHGRIVAGTGRCKAAELLKLDFVPVIRVDFLSEEERRAFALADNRLAELSEWDDVALHAELDELLEAGLDIAEIGFSTADLDFALVGDNDETNDTESLELPDPDAPAVSRVGDLWIIGPHRLYCGDACSAESWEVLLGNERAALVFADPPYNVPIDGHVSGNGRTRHREFVMASGEMSAAEFTAFLRSLVRMCARFSANGSIHYICMDWRHIREILDAADGIYSEFKQLIAWIKTNGGQGAFYRSRHELVFVFKSGKAKHVNNFGLGESGRYRTNVVEYAGVNTFRKGRAADLAAHATVKPTAMVVDFLLDCSNRGDLVVDPCLGSGTTLIAAHRAGRRGAGIELDPGYADTALRRLSDASGLTPILAGDGRSFDEIAACRLSNGKT